MNRIILVGCGKQKEAEATQAMFLYTGRLFLARKQFAICSGHRWMIVSALHGLVKTDQIIEPYDTTMPTQRHAVSRWVEKFKTQFVSTIGIHPGMTLEVHAGVDYVNAIRLALAPFALTIEHPVFGMGIGEQIEAYRQGRFPIQFENSSASFCFGGES